MALAIAKAESGLNPNAQNPESSASGIFQFLDGTFQTYCINKLGIATSLADKDNPIYQINCAIDMMASPGGWEHWRASEFLWRSHVVG